MSLTQNVNTYFMRLLCLFLLLTMIALSPFASVSADNDQTSELRAVGVSVSDLGNPFFVRIAETIREKIRDRFGTSVKVTIRSNAYDETRLESQLEAFIEQQMDLVILVASDPNAIEPTIRQAQRAGIKVVAVDVNAIGADATVTTDNVQAGEVACQFLADRLEGQGNIAIINGPPVSSVIERVAGCKAVLNNYQDIYLLSDTISGGGSVEGGMEAMALLMESHPELDAVFAINDPTASGAAAMAQQSGRTDMVIASVDGAPMAVEAFQSNNPVWAASAAQFPAVMAATAVDLGIDLVNGIQPPQTKILIPTQLLRDNNVHLYHGWN
ncbi:substrate-binding domain-containing protein [Hahella ganghwensis]|uniref:substrate-binding domain-containing protein n=1 Tax=Hahella ganghwensis TaxID=286420 RepID=UPI00036EAD05|nr:substrate-binding domain-containing protein [Hahella ganghwensis]